MKLIRNVLLILAALAAVLFIGCTQTPSNVTLNVTDAPTDASNITAAWITVTKIEYHTTNPDEWVEVSDFAGPKSFDLLSLTNGTTALLGQFTLPAGEISQLRFYVDAPVTGSGTPTSPGCYVVDTLGNETAMFVPSGSTSGFTATGSFDVPVNGTVSLTADFDARKSIKETNSTYNLQPTIRIIADDQAGSIHGTVTVNTATTNDLVVFAYENDTYADSELSTDPIFKNAVTSAAVDSTSGTYTLSYLAPGTYDLVVTEVDSDGNYVNTNLTEIQDVAVTSENTTTENITY